MIHQALPLEILSMFSMSWACRYCNVGSHWASWPVASLGWNQDHISWKMVWCKIGKCGFTWPHQALPALSLHGFRWASQRNRRLGCIQTSAHSWLKIPRVVFHDFPLGVIDLLVGGLKHLFFFPQKLAIIPTDSSFSWFFRGLETTNQLNYTSALYPSSLSFTKTKIAARCGDGSVGHSDGSWKW